MNKQEYTTRFKEIIKWAEKETEKINKNAKAIGLDTNKDKYQKIHKEYEQKINKLKKEYKQ